jgi:hypothetical protein
MATAVSARPHLARHARPGGPREPRNGPGLAPWGVVAIWGSLLAVLAAAGAGFGNNTLVLEVSGSAAGFVLLLAAAVWLDRRLRPRRSWLRQPARIGGVFMLAVAAMLAWLGLAFGGWLVMIAAVPLTAAIGLEIAARRSARTLAAAASGSGPAEDAPGSGHERPAAGRPVTRQAA